MSNETKTLEQRKAEFEARKVQREKDAEAVREKIELVALDFDERLGPRGADWEMIETTEGPIVVVVGSQSAFKKFQESKKGPTDVENFVRPLVKYPEAKDYAAMVDKRPVYAIRCANALGTLYGMKGESESGKF